MYHSLFIHPFTKRCLLVACKCNDYAWSCYKHPYAGFSVDIRFHIVWVQRHVVSGLYGNNMFGFITKCQTLLKNLYHLAFPLAMLASPVIPHFCQHVAESLLWILVALIRNVTELCSSFVFLCWYRRWGISLYVYI